MSEVTLTPSGPPETVIADEPAGVGRDGRRPRSHRRRPRAALAEVVARAALARGWARLGDAGRDVIERYAAYRVGYHRGLDTLRANGWRGSGYVRWEHAGNRGFLRALAGLQRTAAEIGEDDEAERCAHFLRQLDPAWPPAGAGRLTAPVQRRGAVRRGEPSHGPRQGHPRGRRRGDGRPGRPTRSAARAPRDVVAIGGDADALRALGLPVVADDEPGEGPFPATLTALRHALDRRGGRAVVRPPRAQPAGHRIVVDRLRAAAAGRGRRPSRWWTGTHQWTHVAWRREPRSMPLEAARRRGVGSLRRACADLPLERVTRLAAADVADADHPGDLPGAG